MKVYPVLIAVASLAAILIVQNVWSISSSLTGKVVRVYDGDTIKVENIGKVRLIGIDTPEWKGSDRDRYYIRQGISESTLRRIATASREYVEQNAVGKMVVLTTDHEARDRYGRLLAYVHLPDGRLLNRILLEEGLAVVYRRFDFSFKSDFIRAEQSARKMFRGLWSDLKMRAD